MEEIRIDCAHPSEKDMAMAKQQMQTLFRLNHTMPATEEFDLLLKELFPDMGEGSRVNTPLSGVRFNKVKIGKNVVIMPGCLMMSAGGITIEDEAMIAANVQLISNNHDLDNRSIITCRPIRICCRAWIGAGATILPGVTVGENSVVGAGSVVTHDVEPNTVVAGNPARLMRQLK
ncbi:DapH/DapD/GlmU-related protein [Muribaculum intestinale]|uniref:acyltransferase n=2 Tax=Muribaculaceae TaxID=2005473 RepID=UPI0025ADC58B|nr:DapH/DapD/GlmU-related protein [Muribaculum intestinale]